MKLFARPTERCELTKRSTSRKGEKSPLNFLRAYRKEEEGAAVILTLFIFVFMLVMAGLGIDMMRFEMERARLQSTLDAAVLAGAGSPTGTDPELVVRDYFAKSEMSEFLNDFAEGDIVTTLNSSSVTASATMTMDTYLMKLSGVDTLAAHAGAKAELRIPKLEIALVLDVSNSMNSNGKIGNLQTAAKQFVTTIMNSADPGDAVISIVPFSTSVAPSEEIYDALAVDETHDYSECLVFDDDDYNDTALVTEAAANLDLTLQPITQAIYTSRFGNFDDLNVSWRSCYTEDGFRIKPFSASESELHTTIDDMIADGNTTGSLGVKWGAALLDPSFRDVTASLISSNQMDGSLANVPVDYDEGDTVKVIVMMGDGQNTETYFFDSSSQYRGPNSELFHIRHEVEEFLYIYHEGNTNRRWYWNGYEYLCDQGPWRCEYRVDTEENYYIRDIDDFYGPGLATGPGDVIDTTPLPECASITSEDCDDVEDVLLDGRWYVNALTGDRIDGSTFVAFDDTLPGFKSRYRLSWEEAWGLMSPDEYGDLTGNYDAYDEYEAANSNVNGSSKDTRMLDICTSAKSTGKDVVIYTVGFEIAEGGTAETTLKGCASATTHYYRAEGVDITGVFSSIASNVQSLRLTQ